MLIQKYSLFYLFPADGAHGDAVAAHLTHAVTAQEYHVLQSVQTNGAHRL